MSVGGQDIKLLRGMTIEIVSLAVVLRKTTLVEVTFLEDTVLTSTFRENLETLETVL